MSFALALSYTLAQSFASSSLALVLGVWGAFGLLSVKSKKMNKILNAGMLGPSVLPTLFVILGFLNCFSYLGGFPYGFKGVVLVHALVNCGLVSLMLKNAIESKLSGVLELCLVEGASRFKVILQTLRILKVDLANQFMVVFVFSVSSFSIPLILSGGSGLSLEVFAYEQLRIEGNILWSAGLALFQAVLLFFLAKSLSAKTNEVATNDFGVTKNFSLLESKTGLLPVILPSLMLIFGMSFFKIDSSGVGEFLLFLPKILASIPKTLIVGLLSATFIFFSFSAIVFYFPSRIWRDRLSAFAITSVAFWGFLLFVMGGQALWVVILKIAFGLPLIFLPQLFRMYLAADLTRLENQRNVAQALGATPTMIFVEILWPQTKAKVVAAAQLTALWCMGDFAFSSMVAIDSFSFALLIRDMLMSYRLDLAAICCWILLVISALYYVLLGRLFNVNYK